MRKVLKEQLYLAWSSFQQWRNFISPDKTAILSGQQSVLKAALMNVINPMPYIYWSLVAGPLLIAGWREAPAYGVTFLGAFYLVMVCGLLAILGMVSAARNLGSRISRILLGVSVLALAAFGLLQLWRGLLG